MSEVSIVVFQSVSATIILLIAIAGGVLPYLVKKFAKSGKITSWMNCVSGGMLAGVALLHILTESGESLNAACSGFPVSSVIIFVGILLMLIVVKFGHDHHEHEHDHADIPSQPSSTSEVLKGDSHASMSAFGSCNPSCIVDKNNHCHTHDPDNCTETCEIEPSHKHKHAHDHHHDPETEVPTKADNTIKALMLSLMIHDVSEGILLGFQTDSHEGFFLALAIALHKWCDVSCQVIAGMRKGLTFKQNLVFAIPIALATPVSQIITFLVVYFSSASDQSVAFNVVKDCFMSFACGTFLTIVLVEILGHEIEGTPKEVVLKSGFVCLGFCLVAISNIIEVVSGGHDHE